MLKAIPSPKNILLVSVVFQVYPIFLCFIAKFKNPQSKPLAFLGIFLLAEVVLAIIISNWHQKSVSELIDEREILIRLRVNSISLRVIEFAFVITTIIFFSYYREMPTLLALMLIGIPGIIAELYANIAFRKI